ncbi:signal peptidase complex subunit 1 [Lates calcarifer]|uniref:Signal peptidase complex subunit 1 n=2 Tax=Lates TaxID=8186 RepID=A0A4W6DJA5_LATCA|nr:signal peptidase complex subunit 1 [Lates calcarifer]
MGLSQNDVSFLRPEVKLLRFVTVRTKVCQIDLTSSGKMLDIFKSIPTHMDYKGQKLAEQIFQGIILISAVIGFVYGLIIEQFGWTVYIVLAGFAISCVLTLPPWPMYRKNPLSWQPVLPETSGESSQKPQESLKKKKHK